MEERIRATKSGEEYAAAYAVHYVDKDLRKAIQLYSGIVGEHPNSIEAGYSQAQIQNIVRRVVPVQELAEAQKDLAITHIDRKEPQDAAVPASETPSL